MGKNKKSYDYSLSIYWKNEVKSDNFTKCDLRTIDDQLVIIFQQKKKGIFYQMRKTNNIHRKEKHIGFIFNVAHTPPPELCERKFIRSVVTQSTLLLVGDRSYKFPLLSSTSL